MCVHVATLFDYTKDPPKPLLSAIYDGDDVKFYTLFMPKTGKKLYHIFKGLNKIKDIISDERVIINDFKSHIRAFGLNMGSHYDVYNVDVQNDNVSDLNEGKKYLAKMLKDLMLKDDSWRNINANAQIVYQFMEDRGVYVNGEEKHPIYTTDTFSGRSKSKGFNIQGADDSFDIRLGRYDLDYYIHFDWIAADLRVASILSNDTILHSTFEESDPYTEMARELGDGFDRNECKIEFLTSIYSLDTGNPILELYPDFHEWMKSNIEIIKDGKPLKTILGRSFEPREKNHRSVFSGIISGSVAHAMQICMNRIYSIFPDNLLTETHDSITMLSNREDIKAIMSSVKDIMLNPFDGFLEGNPSFPLKIYVGNIWKKWKLLRECR